MCCSKSRETNRLIVIKILGVFLILSLISFIYSLVAMENYISSRFYPTKISFELIFGLIFILNLLGLLFSILDSKVLFTIYVFVLIFLFCFLV